MWGCVLSKPKLTADDFTRAANRLRCGVPEIKAVAQVESAGAGFYGDGFPVILFERHLFKRFTKGKYSAGHPDISGPQGGYGPAGKNQRVKFAKAFALDADAAMKSCSWGKFQILGSNHKVCGFDTVGEFVDAMKESEGRQLDAFVAFVIGNSLDRYLRAKDWAKFARGYNGPNYAINNYDSKMATAYKRFFREAFDPIPSPVASKPSEQGGQPTVDPQTTAGSTGDHKPPIETTVTRTEGDVTVEASKTNQQDVNVPATVSQPEPYLGIGFWGVVKKDFAAATGGNLSLAGLSEYAQQASGWPPWVVGIISKVAVGALIATFGYFLFRVIHYGVDTWKKNQKVKVEVSAATDVTRKDVNWQ